MGRRGIERGGSGWKGEVIRQTIEGGVERRGAEEGMGGK